MSFYPNNAKWAQVHKDLFFNTCCFRREIRPRVIWSLSSAAALYVLVFAVSMEVIYNVKLHSFKIILTYYTQYVN